ncbi:uncharacterized protein LOC122505835 [Leptopilina heterotoma]|uniref:uncharacterized protein LOC122505835 n=1 Tax=Leptopilina heterotoma TaxID=63436 RepID=UPI001CA7C331|nr:uncharacterized protein LOC122505835 [Leptopilina heterotoma]
MQQQESTSSTPSAHRDEPMQDPESKLGRGKRVCRPNIKFTPSQYDALKSDQQLSTAANLQETPVNTGADELRHREKLDFLHKRDADSDSEDETAISKLLVKKIKQGKKHVAQTNDDLCYHAAFGNSAEKGKSLRDILTKEVVTECETQTTETGDPYLKVEELKNENDKLLRVIVTQLEEIAALKEANISNSISLQQSTSYEGPTLDQIRNVISEAIAPVQKELSIMKRNIENPTDAALAAFGDADSRVTFAGVDISNGMLVLAKDSNKLSARITNLVRGYWSPEVLAVAGYNKPKNVTDEEYVQVTDEDIRKIRRIVIQLEKDDTTKLSLTETDLSFKNIKTRVLQSVKGTKKYL